MRRSASFLAVVGMLLMGVASTDVVDAAEPETATLTIVKEITAESVDYLGSSSPRSFHFNIPGFYPDQPIYTDLYFRITPSFGETENGTQYLPWTLVVTRFRKSYTMTTASVGGAETTGGRPIWNARPWRVRRHSL